MKVNHTLAILSIVTALSISISCQRRSADSTDEYSYADKSGFEPITNGEDLEGWTMQGKGLWTIEQGEVVGRQDPSEKEDSWLFTSTEWSDFILQLEFFVPEKCNSGIGIRMPKDSVGSPDVHGFEVQISDLEQLRLTGSLLHHVESRGDNRHIPNQWNKLVVICEGDHIRVYLNDKDILNENVKGSLKGRIGLQVPKGEDFSKQVVRFRNLNLKEL